MCALVFVRVCLVDGSTFYVIRASFTVFSSPRTHVFLFSFIPFCLSSYFPCYHPILSFMTFQGAAKIMDGARSALGKAKQAAGKILDAAEEVGSVSAMAKKALGGLLLELHGSEDIDME